MLISVKEAAELLKTSERTIQLRCKRFNVKKIGNVYQLTNEIVNQWQTTTNNETNRTLRNVTRKKVSFNNSLLMWVTAFITIVILTTFYLNLERQIKETNKDLRQERIEHKTDVKELQKIVDSQKDTINKKELEIQSLKIKDSLRLFRRW
jgi:short subunit fatty acids transporter